MIFLEFCFMFKLIIKLIEPSLHKIHQVFLGKVFNFNITSTQSEKNQLLKLDINKYSHSEKSKI